MFDFLVSLLKEELKCHPNIVTVLVLTSAAILGYSYQVFAQQGYVDGKLGGINEKIASVEMSINRRYYEQRIAAVAAEIYQLERLSELKKATERDEKRLGDLRTEKEALTRELARVDRGEQIDGV